MLLCYYLLIKFIHVYTNAKSLIMKISNNFLYGDNGKRVTYIPSPNRGKIDVPKYLMMHYTEATTAASTIEWFQNPSAKVSSHLLIGLNGSITQFVPFNVIAWHAGDSSWDGEISLNKYAIGIELVNAGRLSREGDHWICATDGVTIPADEILMAQHKYETFRSAWQIYSQTQINTAIAVGKVLADYYALTDVLGHDDVAPGRKVDPGPAFPMENFRAAVLS